MNNTLVKRVASRTKHYLRKAKHTPRYLRRRIRNKVSPVAARVRKTRHLAHRLVLLAVSSRERELRSYKKEAHHAMTQNNWEEASRILQGIVDKFAERAPLDDWLDLARSLAAKDQFSQAEKVISDGMELFPGRKSALSATQSDLHGWLLLSEVKAQISLQKILKTTDEYKKKVAQYKSAKKKRKTSSNPDELRVAVFTAISGGYDSIKPPEVLDHRLDYVVFTDTIADPMGIFDLRPLPYLDGDKTRSARFVKTNAHNLLHDYDVVVWIDANLMITGDIYKLAKDTLAAGKPLGAIKHPVRTSVYEEMDMCIRGNKDDVAAILEQREAYRRIDYDCDDLIESNVLVYDLRDNRVRDFLSDWWGQIDKYSRRDQLSINYCLDKNGISWHALTKRPHSSRNHPALALTPHGSKGNYLPMLAIKLGSKAIDPMISQSYIEIKESRIKGHAKVGVDVVVCVHNALEEVKKCLKAVKSHRKANLSLIIVDDGSDKPTADYLKEFHKNNSWTRLFRHNKAKGYTKAANRGMKESSAEFLILLNSDTIVTASWYEKMVDVAFSNHGIGIVGPMSNAASTQSLPDHESTKNQTAINGLPEGVTVGDMNIYCEKWASADLIPRVPLVHGFCFGIKREVLDSIGYFDDVSFPRGYGEENDFCFRAADAGFGLALATHTYVYHEKSKSFTSAERQKNMNAGARAFRDKHGQRRITRAVQTMRENPILQDMRKKADNLYTRELLYKGGKKELLVKVNHKTMSDIDYPELTHELVRLNNQLINWKELPKNGTSSKTLPTASVIVLVLNNIEMTLRCIESVMEAQNKTNFELIVVSNGSNSDTILGLREVIKKYPQIKLVFIEQNLNYALGNNIGFSEARGEKIVFLNNDTYVTDYWLDRLLKPLKEKEETKATQPALFYPDGSVQCLGVVFSEKSTLGYALYANKYSHSPEVVKDRKLQAVTGACMAVRSKEFAKVKGFDPTYINGQEDVDLCLRLTGNDKLNACYSVAKSIVYHDESKTPGRGKYVYQNRKTFINRWNGKIKADDTTIYTEDGYRVRSWRADSEESNSKGVPMFIPRLGREVSIIQKAVSAFSRRRTT
jgi:GT2 family glycosyltransferase